MKPTRFLVAVHFAGKYLGLHLFHEQLDLGNMFNPLWGWNKTFRDHDIQQMSPRGKYQSQLWSKFLTEINLSMAVGLFGNLFHKLYISKANYQGSSKIFLNLKLTIFYFSSELLILDFLREKFWKSAFLINFVVSVAIYHIKGGESRIMEMSGFNRTRWMFLPLILVLCAFLVPLACRGFI